MKLVKLELQEIRGLLVDLIEAPSSVFLENTEETLTQGRFREGPDCFLQFRGTNQWGENL